MSAFGRERASNHSLPWLRSLSLFLCICVCVFVCVLVVCVHVDKGNVRVLCVYMMNVHEMLSVSITLFSCSLVGKNSLDGCLAPYVSGRSNSKNSIECVRFLLCFSFILLLFFCCCCVCLVSRLLVGLQHLCSEALFARSLALSSVVVTIKHSNNSIYCIVCLDCSMCVRAANPTC